MRDTAGFEEAWEDANEADLDQAVMTAGLLHDVKYSNLVAAYRAENIKAETEHLSVKFKYLGRANPSQLVFKEPYRDEHTYEELPIGFVRSAMPEELVYVCDGVWVGAPLCEAQNDPDGKRVGSRWMIGRKK